MCRVSDVMLMRYDMTCDEILCYVMLNHIVSPFRLARAAAPAFAAPGVQRLADHPDGQIW